ncbi:MAG TPA: class I SAM-dependent methyltransferase [Bacteroidia bacterium]|jgi:ubiquinone/menaquinone biosynthesis C-methylase UbiE|nr:class I SAM-dependent methyltransferase [Bacteroidia bacterium]
MSEMREKGYNTKEDWSKGGLRNWKDYKWLYTNLVKHYTSDEPMDKVLDIGCGHADFMDTCVHFGLPASRVYGIEGDPDSYAVCTAKGYQISSIDLDTDKLPYPDNHFSFVICSQLIEHIKREAGVALMKEIFRVLKKDGLLLIYSPSYYNKTGRTMPFHLYCWKPYELRDLMQEIGYQRITTKISALQWYDLKTYQEDYHQKKYKQKPNVLEIFLKYSVYGLFLLTKNQRLLSQTAFAAYK